MIYVPLLMIAQAVSLLAPPTAADLEKATGPARTKFAACVASTAKDLAVTSREAAPVLADLAVFRCGKTDVQLIGDTARNDARMEAIDAIVTARR